MAYALVLVLADEKRGQNVFRWIRILIRWFRGFSPAKVGVSLIEANAEVSFYMITMPEPKVFYSKNRIGKKRTMKRWFKVIHQHKIRKYLLEEPLREYLDEGWCIEEGSYLTESIMRNLPHLFKMEPLRSLDTEMMTLTISGVDKKWLTDGLIEVFRKFRQINTIREAEPLEQWWEDFFSETGIPICKTDDASVLARSDVWISIANVSETALFRGIQIDISKKDIFFTKTRKRYHIGYAFSLKLVRQLGISLIRKFNPEYLACFLLHALVHEKGCLPADAEKILGIKMSIIRVGYCS